MSVTTMPATGAAEGAEPAKKGGKKKLLIILVAVLAIGGGAYWFVLKPHPAGPPSPGVVVVPMDLTAAGWRGSAPE